MKKIKKPTRAEKENAPVNDDLRVRIIAVKKKLPASGVSSFFLEINPEYDNTKGRSKLNNVLQLRSFDEEITKRLEAMAETIENAKNKENV